MDTVRQCRQFFYFDLPSVIQYSHQIWVTIRCKLYNLVILKLDWCIFLLVKLYFFFFDFMFSVLFNLSTTSTCWWMNIYTKSSETKMCRVLSKRRCCHVRQLQSSTLERRFVQLCVKTSCVLRQSYRPRTIHLNPLKPWFHVKIKQEAQLSLRDRATRACQLKSGKVLHKCRRLVSEKLWN